MGCLVVKEMEEMEGRELFLRVSMVGCLPEKQGSRKRVVCA